MLHLFIHAQMETTGVANTQNNLDHSNTYETWFNEAHVLLHKCHITTDCGMRCLKPILCRAFETDDTEWIVFSHLYIVCIVYKNGRHSIIFVRNIWARCPGCLGQDVFTCRLSSSHCRSEQQQEHISVSAFACYAKTEGKKGLLITSAGGGEERQ